MAWTWRYEKADGSAVNPTVGQEDFPTQGDAESWIGENWKQLVEEGADQATLLDDGSTIYTMSLHEA
ncbi:hypothetical protein ACIQGZ_11010 [Streptomyces sp. NPDC092296]|uniref:hypothetical protein n=1 Tax=Streptomyces sp. NPDC092296 TaxID=3366012 RepID=UPI003810CA7B